MYHPILKSQKSNPMPQQLKDKKDRNKSKMVLPKEAKKKKEAPKKMRVTRKIKVPKKKLQTRKNFLIWNTARSKIKARNKKLLLQMDQ